MATQQTTDRRRLKTEWLRGNPVCLAWLRENRFTSLAELCKTPEATILASAMKAAGIYSKTTVTADICSTMRRLAASVEDVPPPAPNDLAISEIQTILSRPGVCRDTVLRHFRP